MGVPVGACVSWVRIAETEEPLAAQASNTRGTPHSLRFHKAPKFQPTGLISTRRQLGIKGLPHGLNKVAMKPAGYDKAVVNPEHRYVAHR